MVALIASKSRHGHWLQYNATDCSSK